VNRSLKEELALEGTVAGFDDLKALEQIVLVHRDPKAANTKAKPDAVIPGRIDATRIDKGALLSRLPPLSWNVIRLKAGKES
jgi:alpha-N-arabinofuranosidase